MNTTDKITLLEETIAYLQASGAVGTALQKRLKKLLADIDDIAPVRPKSFGVRAILRSDDDNVSDSIEAAPWLHTLDDETLAFLCRDTGANDTTDDLYWRLDGEIGEDAWGIHVAARLGRYLSAINESYARDTVGFSVRLDEGDLHNWVQENRPAAWKLYQEENP